MQNIKVFIDFANFYQCFIKSFSKIAISLISILKTIELFNKFILKTFKNDNNKVAGSGNGANKMIKNLPKSKKSNNIKCKNLTSIANIEATEKSMFLIFNNKKSFNHL